MLNGTVICKVGKNPKFMLEGKRYTFVDGKFRREDGDMSSQYLSVDDFNKKIALAEIELVTLPIPHKKLLQSGDRLVFNDTRDDRFVLLQTDSTHSKDGNFVGCFNPAYNDFLGDVQSNGKLFVTEIWRGNLMIACVPAKSEQQLEIERIEAVMRDLSAQQSKLAEDLNKLKLK